MGIKLLAVAVVGLCPALLRAQTNTPKADGSAPAVAAAPPDTGRHGVVRATAHGDVSRAAPVTSAMLKAQADPNLIGSPAWWQTHATADGKPARS